MEIKKGAKRDGNIEDRRIRNTAIKAKLAGVRNSARESGVTDVVRTINYERHLGNKKVY